MRFDFATARPILKILTSLAVASGAVIVGCSPEAGTAPSGKSQTREALTREVEKSSETKGTNAPAPKSIKTKLLNVKGQ